MHVVKEKLGHKMLGTGGLLDPQILNIVQQGVGLGVSLRIAGTMYREIRLLPFNEGGQVARVAEVRAVGVRDVLALRGDRSPTRPESPDFAHASDLAQFVWQTQPEFDIHAACYPEGHPEAATLAQDVANLRFKQEAGATHLLTQLFFDNMHFYRFLNLARRAGITLPVSAGVMPIVKRSQIERTVALSSASLPSEFTRMISRYQDDPESLYAAGIDYAVQQLRDLIEGGADGVHLYAMNDAKVAAAVYEGIKDLL